MILPQRVFSIERQQLEFAQKTGFKLASRQILF
jgi:hypothetical protein